MRILFLITSLCLLIQSHYASAASLPEDKRAARILTYYGVGQEHSPATSVTYAQFKSHMRELYNGDYNVVALPDVLKAYDKDAALPANSVVITFDGSHKSTLTRAAPLLKKYKFPFTVLLSPERLQSNDKRYLNVKDLKKLRKLPLLNFGIHPTAYDDYAYATIEQKKHHLNKALGFYRDMFKTQPQILAFSNGLYTQDDLNIIRPYRFKAVLGHQSGVAYKNNHGDILPRFIMTENYANQDRFKMIVNTLPLPMEDHVPKHTVIENNEPIIGFTANEKLELDHLKCYASGQPKPAIELLNSRIEIRLTANNDDARTRVNCTIPEGQNDQNQEIQWRWSGFLIDAS